MLNKRGQITIFIIVAIIIIAVAGIYYFTNSDTLRDEPSIPESKEVYSFVQYCIEKSISESIVEIGQNGGYMLPAKFSTEGGFAYYYFNYTNYMPSKEKITEELSSLIKGKLFACTNDFKEFTEINIFQKDPEIITLIGNNKILFDIKYPLTLEKGNSTSILEDFGEYRSEVRLGLLYDSIYEIIEESDENVCLSCIGEKAIENDFYVEVRNYDDNSIIFIFKDENSIINDGHFVFKFANKYILEKNEE